MEPVQDFQIVPDTHDFIDLDLADIEAGMQQCCCCDHLAPMGWTPCPECVEVLGNMLKPPSPVAQHAGSKEPRSSNSHEVCSVMPSLLQEGHDCNGPVQHHEQFQMVPDPVAVYSNQTAACTVPSSGSDSSMLSGASSTMQMQVMPEAAEAAMVPSLAYSQMREGPWLGGPVGVAAADVLGLLPPQSAAVWCWPPHVPVVPAAQAAPAAFFTHSEVEVAARKLLPAAAAAPAAALGVPVAATPIRARAEALARYRAKKARRSAAKVVRYQRRKDIADKRPRVRGRFVKAAGMQASTAAETAEEEAVQSGLQCQVYQEDELGTFA